jgi:Family of unknown function (DUF5941)
LNPFELFRDDGPIARACGAMLGRAVRLPAIALLVIGAVPLLVLLVVERGEASDGAVGATIGWLVVVGGASRGRPQGDRLRWAVPPVLRLVEYAAILWLGALAGRTGPAAAFALLAAVAYHHYDLFYRLRFLGVAPPQWVGDVAGGWEGRLVAGYVLLVTGALPAGFFAAAAVFGALFAGESITAWMRARPGDVPGFMGEGAADGGGE